MKSNIFKSPLLLVVFGTFLSGCASNESARNATISELNAVNFAVKAYESDKAKIADVCIGRYGVPKVDESTIEFGGFEFICSEDAGFAWVYPEMTRP